MAIHSKTSLIRHFIITQLEDHPVDIAKFTAKVFQITPQAARNHLKALEEEGTIEMTGQTRSRRYVLKSLVDEKFMLPVPGLAEDIVWSQYVLPRITECSKNVLLVLSIAVTEMVNNVIDHSESPIVSLHILRTASLIDITISDLGVGVFRKVQKAFDLADERQAILELSKGKLTTAPANHSGYGIFFTSRMVDVFRMTSGGLHFSHERNEDDWLIGHGKEVTGTRVQMAIATNSPVSPQSVYDQFCAAPESDLGFHKTHVPLQLAQFGNEPLVSRSQAKRALARVDRFTEVLIDFKGIEMIGQGFADEIFRVYKSQNPGIEIIAINANPQIQQIIRLTSDRTVIHDSSESQLARG